MEEDGKDINLLNASSHVQQQQQHTILIQVLELGFSCRQSDRQNADDDDDDGCDDDDDGQLAQCIISPPSPAAAHNSYSGLLILLNDNDPAQ